MIFDLTRSIAREEEAAAAQCAQSLQKTAIGSEDSQSEPRLPAPYDVDLPQVVLGLFVPAQFAVWLVRF
jgi:hypothetical protein